MREEVLCPLQGSRDLSRSVTVEIEISNERGGEQREEGGTEGKKPKSRERWSQVVNLTHFHGTRASGETFKTTCAQPHTCPQPITRRTCLVP